MPIRKAPTYAVLTGSVLIAIAGCASLDSKIAKAWKIEPVLTVTHSDTSSQGYYELGRYLDGSQAWNKAIDAYRKAIAANARNVEAYNGLGVDLARMGQLANAETTLRQGVALAPGLAHIRSNLGYVLLLMGKPADAVNELRAAVDQDGSNTVAAANLRVALERIDPARVAGASSGSDGSVGRHTPAAAEAQADAGHATENALRTEGAPIIVSVPAPITTAEVPTPLASGISVPAAVQVAVASPTSMAMATPVVATPIAPVRTRVTMDVTDRPNVGSLVAPPLTTAAVEAHPSLTFASAAASFTTPPVMTPLRLEVSNGNGVNGMAAGVGRWLAAQGISTQRLSNQRGFDQRETVVQYRVGYEEAAERVALSMPATAKTGAQATQGLRSDVRLIIGKDLIKTSTCLVHDACRPPTPLVALARP